VIQETMGKTFMGLSVHCAGCPNTKDPVRFYHYCFQNMWLLKLKNGKI